MSVVNLAKSTRLYALKNKTTGKYLTGLSYVSKGKRKGQYDLNYIPNPDWNSIGVVNYIVKQAINHGYGTELDQLEVETYKLEIKQISGTIRMKNLKSRIGQELLVEKLAGHI